MVKTYSKLLLCIGEPNNYGGSKLLIKEACLHVKSKMRYCLNDESCTAKLSYICEETSTIFSTRIQNNFTFSSIENLTESEIVSTQAIQVTNWNPWNAWSTCLLFRERKNKNFHNTIEYDAINITCSLVCKSIFS